MPKSPWTPDAWIALILTLAIFVLLVKLAIRGLPYAHAEIIQPVVLAVVAIISMYIGAKVSNRDKEDDDDDENRG